MKYLIGTFVFVSFIGCQKENQFQSTILANDFKITRIDSNTGVTKISFAMLSTKPQFTRTSYYVEFAIPSNGTKRPNYRDVFTINAMESKTVFEIEFPITVTNSEVAKTFANVIELKQVSSLSDILNSNHSFNMYSAKYPEHAKSLW